MSSDSQQAQWRHGGVDKQSTASTSEIASHQHGRDCTTCANLSLLVANTPSSFIGSGANTQQTFPAFKGSPAVHPPTHPSAVDQWLSVPSIFFSPSSFAVSRLSTVGSCRQSGLLPRPQPRCIHSNKHATCILNSLDAVMTSVHAHSPTTIPP